VQAHKLLDKFEGGVPVTLDEARTLTEAVRGACCAAQEFENRVTGYQPSRSSD